MKETILYDGNTPFGHYQVIDMTYEGRPARVLFSGKKAAAFSGIAKDDKPELLFDYNQRFLELAQGLQPKNVLVIGGGAHTLPVALLEKGAAQAVDSVEIDPGLHELARKFFNLTDMPALRLHYADGTHYLQRTPERYDVIIVDAFVDLNMPESLADDRACHLIHQRLKPGGTVAVNIVSSYEGRGSRPLRALANTYADRFVSVQVFPASNKYPQWIKQNFLLIASKRVKDLSKHMRFDMVMELTDRQAGRKL